MNEKSPYLDDFSKDIPTILNLRKEDSYQSQERIKNSSESSRISQSLLLDNFLSKSKERLPSCGSAQSPKMARGTHHRATESITTATSGSGNETPNANIL